MSIGVVLGLVVLFFLLAIGLQLAGKGKQADGYPYKKNPTLFSPAERSFLGVLEQAIGQEYRIFGKVRVADVVSVKSMGNRSAWQRAFNKISAKHFDYILCRPDDLSIVCAIELDDSSHQKRKRQERDAFLAGLCKAISMPLVQYPAKRAYTITEVRETLMSVLESPKRPEVQSSTVNAAASVEAVKAPSLPFPSVPRAETLPEPVLQPASPPCPKCSGTMLRRKITSGSSAGKEFWGCNDFPKCRGVIPLQAAAAELKVRGEAEAAMPDTR